MALRGEHLEVPIYFSCPISLEMMGDPVACSNGQTYDRCNIERWLNAGNRTCPVTRLRLDSCELIPNITLQRCIRSWSLANNYKGADEIPTSPTTLNEYHVKKIFDNIKSGSGRTDSLRTLRCMAKSSERSRKLLFEEGVLVIIDLVLSYHKSNSTLSDHVTRTMYSNFPDENNEAFEEALGIMAVLSVNETAREKLASVGLRHLSSLAWFLCRGSLDAKLSVASILECLVVDDESLTEVGAVEGIMQGLVTLLKEDLYPSAITASLRSLYALCLLPRNRRKAVEAGVVTGIVELLPGAKRGTLEGALALLEMLSTFTTGREALCKHALALPAIIHAISTISISLTERAVAVLHRMLMYSGDPQVHASAAKAGVFTKLLLIMQSQGNQDTRQKCQDLLKLLQRTCKSNPCIRTIKYSSEL